MSLNMSGHIDGIFKSVDATRSGKSGGAYVNGHWVAGVETTNAHNVNLQPLNEKEIQSLSIGAERIGDMRKIYVNDGDMYNIAESDIWTFTGIDGEFKTVSLDNRPWRNYCKAIVSRIDE